MATGRGGYVGLVRVEDDRLDVAAAFDAAFVKSAGGLGPAAEAILGEVGWPVPPDSRKHRGRERRRSRVDRCGSPVTGGSWSATRPGTSSRLRAKAWRGR